MLLYDMLWYMYDVSILMFFEYYWIMEVQMF